MYENQYPEQSGSAPDGEREPAQVDPDQERAERQRADDVAMGGGGR